MGGSPFEMQADFANPKSVDNFQKALMFLSFHIILASFLNGQSQAYIYFFCLQLTKHLLFVVEVKLNNSFFLGNFSNIFLTQAENLIHCLAN